MGIIDSQKNIKFAGINMQSEKAYRKALYDEYALKVKFLKSINAPQRTIEREQSLFDVCRVNLADIEAQIAEAMVSSG